MFAHWIWINTVLHRMYYKYYWPIIIITSSSSSSIYVYLKREEEELHSCNFKTPHASPPSAPTMVFSSSAYHSSICNMP